MTLTNNSTNHSKNENAKVSFLMRKETHSTFNNQVQAKTTPCSKIPADGTKFWISNAINFGYDGSFSYTGRLQRTSSGYLEIPIKPRNTPAQGAWTNLIWGNIGEHPRCCICQIDYDTYGITPCLESYIELVESIFISSSGYTCGVLPRLYEMYVVYMELCFPLK